MPDDFPRLTVCLGPQSQHALGLNNVIRIHRGALAGAGMTAMPNRKGGPAMRVVASRGAKLDVREAEFDALYGGPPTFCIATKFLGSLRKGVQNRELMPDAAAQLAALAEIAGAAPMRVIVAPDRLSDIFATEASTALNETIRATPWEVLYDLSWVELVTRLRESLPRAEVLVLTHRGFALGGAPLVAGLFGPAAGAVRPRALLFQSLNATGRAVLGRIEGDSDVDAAVARELYDTFAERADDATCRERLGLDRLTVKLLSQRFNEDLERIRFMDGVGVL